MSDDYTTDWILPAGITLAQAQASPGAEAMFPQTLTTAPPCGSVIQEDHYNADPAALGSTLDWVDGAPEDHAIVTSWRFFETAPCPPPLVCAPGTVPGWLDEAGNPTSCVSDDPRPTVTETPVPPTPHLAETGVTGTGYMLALVLIVLGAAVYRAQQAFRRK